MNKPKKIIGEKVNDLKDLKHHELCDVIDEILRHLGLSVYKETTPDYTSIEVHQTSFRLKKTMEHGNRIIWDQVLIKAYQKLLSTTMMINGYYSNLMKASSFLMKTSQPLKHIKGCCRE